MRDFTSGRARASGLPILLVTHDPEDAQAAGGRVPRFGEGGAVAGD
jgi:putative thiamine transport system ATP-binding protein